MNNLESRITRPGFFRRAAITAGLLGALISPFAVLGCGGSKSGGPNPSPTPTATPSPSPSPTPPVNHAPVINGQSSVTKTEAAARATFTYSTTDAEDGPLAPPEVTSTLPPYASYNQATGTLTIDTMYGDQGATVTLRSPADSDGATSTKDVTVTVNPASTVPRVAFDEYATGPERPYASNKNVASILANGNLASRLEHATNEGKGEFVWISPNKVLFNGIDAATLMSHVYTADVNLSTGNLSNILDLTLGTEDCIQPQISSDGQRIAYVRGYIFGSEPDVETADIDGGNKTRETTDGNLRTKKKPFFNLAGEVCWNQNEYIQGSDVNYHENLYVKRVGGTIECLTPSTEDTDEKEGCFDEAGNLFYSGNGSSNGKYQIFMEGVQLTQSALNARNPDVRSEIVVYNETNDADTQSSLRMKKTNEIDNLTDRELFSNSSYLSEPNLQK